MNLGNQNEPDADAILVKIFVLYAEYIANSPPREYPDIAKFCLGSYLVLLYM